jgi:hypothetical protein
MKNVDSQRRILDSASVAGAIRHSSLVIFFCLLFSISAATSFAQSSNRWLLVFNTSAAMRDRAPGMQAVTQDLLTTAMHGTIRPGDDIGIWTYDAALKAENATLTWYPNAAPSITDNTLDFLRHHSYDKNASFADVMANLLRVIKMSDVITVVLISDGSDTIKGTPFDDRIAAFYKTNYSPQKKARMPIVTVLRGEKGVITANTLALAPWPVDIPAVPPAPPIREKITAQKPAPAEPAAPKPVPSLVIIGKKAETVYNVPTDLPDHSGEPAAQPPATPPPTETTPAVTKTEIPVASTPEPALAPKVDEKSKPVAAPVIAATAPAQTPAAVETPKPVQPTEPQVATAPESKEPAVATTTESPKVEAAATPQNGLFSSRNIAIASVTFTLLVCGLLIRSGRNARRASLITRSLERERE